MNVNCVIRTRLHACFASNAPVAAEIDNPVFALPESRYRTDLHAGRVCAMIAALHGKNSAGTGKFAFFYVLHPRPVHSDRQFVFLLASDGAGMAADALTVVNDEAVVHGKTLYRRNAKMSSKHWK